MKKIWNYRKMTTQKEKYPEKKKIYGDQKSKKRKFSDGSNNSDLSDDAKLSICSGDFDKDLEDSDNLLIDEEATPMQKPKKRGKYLKKRYMQTYVLFFIMNCKKNQKILFSIHFNIKNAKPI